MTSYLQDPLWWRISAYQTDAPGDLLPFSKKLAQQQGWTPERTARTISEYKRFLYLCCILPAGASPSNIVDEVWHLHLTYTADYWTRLCRETIGRDLHHHPSRGGSDEAQKHRDWYADTLLHYRETFGEAPPTDIWPAPGEQVALTLPKQPQRFGFETPLLLILPFAASAIMYRQGMPFRLSGPHFLVFYALLAGCWLGIAAICYRRLNRALGAALSPLRITDDYEGAYLAGGVKRVQLMFLTDGIDRSVLLPRAPGNYAVSREAAGWTGYIGAAHIATRDVVSVSEIKDIAARIAAPYARKYSGLSNASRLPLPAKLLLYLMVLIGVARVVQGIANGRPVGFLVFLIICFTLAALQLRWQGGFHVMSLRSLRGQAVDVTEGITAPLARTVIFSGLAELVLLPAYHHLERYFGRGDGSGGDSGGSCSSGCGGGGGCGGCGGD